jgi:hypothetical protein
MSANRTIERQELYDQVWSAPMRDVAKQYAISDVTLRKICAKMDVPTPPQGYWLARKRPPRTPLSPAVETTREIYELRTLPRGLKHVDAGALAAVETVPNVPAVPSRLPADVHPLVEMSLVPLRQGRLVHSRCVDIWADEDLLERALRIMDTLLKACTAAGYEAEVLTKAAAKQRDLDAHTWTPDAYRHHPESDYVTGLHINGEFLPIGLAQRDLRLALIAKRWAGRNLQRVWADTKTRMLEDNLAPALRGIALVAEAAKQERLERKRWQDEWDAAEQRKRDKQWRREQDALRSDTLVAHIEALDKAARIRALLAHAQATSPDGNSLRSWAVDYAARLERTALDLDHAARTIEPEARQIDAKFGKGNQPVPPYFDKF